MLRRVYILPMRNNTLVLSLLILLACAALGQLPPELQNNPDVPKNLKSNYVGLLVESGKPAPTLSKEDHERLRNQHFAYIKLQVLAGKYAVVGPFLDGGRIVGMAIVNAASAEEAQKILSGDPLVKSGLLAVEVHPAMFVDLSGVRAEYANSK